MRTRGPDPDGRTPALSLSLCRRLPGFSLDVRWEARSRRLAILGASGSGKSSTLRAIAGLDRAAADGVALDGRALGHLAPHRRGAALVPQDYALLPHLPVWRQLRFARGASEERARRWTGRLGLDGLEHRLPDALSLGQRQRVALGRALARPASALLLLDEPFSALDAALRRRLCGEMLRLQAEAGLLTVLVTHDPGEAALLADEVLLLRRGAVLGCGPVAALFARPGSEAAARLLGAEVIGRARAVAGGLDLGGACLPLPPPGFAAGTELGWSARPHQMRLVAAGTAGALPGEVLRLGPVRDGQREAVLRLGRSVLSAQADPGGPGVGACGVLLDGGAMQVWPV